MNRLDKELHSRGLSKSRTAAAELITSGVVAVNGVVCTKVSQAVSEKDKIEIIGDAPESLKYVSRGGVKLGYALKCFHTNLKGRICVDIGASTGGFTDCMLQNGAKRVYAVDVGTAQLAESLRRDPRVVSIEQCDVRSVKLPEKADFAAVDVSFISVRLVLPELKRLLNEDSDAIVLIKPQFELGKKHNGIVTDRKVQEGVVCGIVDLAKSLGYFCYTDYITESPIMGKSGNREFLLGIRGIG